MTCCHAAACRTCRVRRWELLGAILSLAAIIAFMFIVG